MKSRLLVGLLFGWQALAGAQVPAFESAALDPDAERQRISAERADHEAVYLRAERQCYSRFAVNDCLREARKDRRLAIDDLRRQELLLNDMERKAKALEAIKRIQTNLANQQEKALQDASQTAKPP